MQCKRRFVVVVENSRSATFCYIDTDCFPSIFWGSWMNNTSIKLLKATRYLTGILYMRRSLPYLMIIIFTFDLWISRVLVGLRKSRESNWWKLCMLFFFRSYFVTTRVWHAIMSNLLGTHFLICIQEQIRFSKTSTSWVIVLRCYGVIAHIHSLLIWTQIGGSCWFVKDTPDMFYQTECVDC